MPEVIRRHALLFTVALGGVVLLVLVVLMRQKSSTTSTSSTPGSGTSTASDTAGDSGLTSGYGPNLSENITNVYGLPTGSGSGSSGGGGSTSSVGGSSGPSGHLGIPSPLPPVAPPTASGGVSVTVNPVYSAGGWGRVPPELGGSPRVRRLASVGGN